MKSFGASPSRCFFVTDHDDNFLKTPSKKQFFFPFSFFNFIKSYTNNKVKGFVLCLLQIKKTQRMIAQEGKKTVLHIVFMNMVTHNLDITLISISNSQTLNRGFKLQSRLWLCHYLWYHGRLLLCAVNM